MHPELENLVNNLLSNGEITERSRELLMKKAEQLGVDAIDFELELEGFLAAAKTKTAPPPTPAASNKEGTIKKCPACGAVVESFSTKCKDCGNEFRSANAVSSSQKLSLLLNEAADKVRKSKEELQLSGGVNRSNSHLLNPMNIAKEIHTIQASIISSFPVPNTKEDLLEFIALTDAEAQKKTNKIGGYVFDGSDMITNAWQSKRQQILSKAKFTFKDDLDLLKELAFYQQANLKNGSNNDGSNNTGCLGLFNPFVFLIKLAENMQGKK